MVEEVKVGNSKKQQPGTQKKEVSAVSAAILRG